MFVFGALTYTREVLKIIGVHDEKRRIYVHKIYNYLYGFSVNRLEHIIQNPYLSLLILKYYQNNGPSRIFGNSNMRKEAHAYKEALLNLILISPVASRAANQIMHVNLDPLRDESQEE